MPKQVKKRPYDSSGRKAAAEATRRAILEAARRVFLARGYAGATMPAIAEEAGIALDTVYAAVGKKPALFRLLVETIPTLVWSARPDGNIDYVNGRVLQYFGAPLGDITDGGWTEKVHPEDLAFKVKS